MWETETIVGVVLTGLGQIGQTEFSTWLNGCKKRISDARGVPENNDIVKGIRTAHLCALRIVAERHRKALSELPDQEIGKHERPFSLSVFGFLDERLRVFREHNFATDINTLDDFDQVLDEIIESPTQENISSTPGGARERAITRALEEIERDTGLSAPPIFLRAFRGELGSAGWYDAFSLYIAEELKTNERFRSIFESERLVDLKKAVGQIASDLLANHADLTGFFEGTRNQLSRIEAKLDILLEEDDIKYALAKAEVELDKVRDLARELFRVVLKRDVPDDQLYAAFLEAAVAWGESNPMNAVDRSDKLSPELDDLVEQSKHAYAANDIEGFYRIRSEIVDVQERAYKRALNEENEARPCGRI